MKNRWFKICLNILVVLLVIVLGAGFYVEKLNNQKQTAWTEELRQAAKPYELEIKQLQSKLDNVKNSINVTDTKPEVLLLLQIKNTKELSKAEKWLSEYDFPVTIVIDAALSTAETNTILQGIKGSSYFSRIEVDMMLSGNPSNDGIMDQAKEKKELFSKEAISFSNCWFFDKNENNSSNTNLLAQNNLVGYSQLTDYGKNLKSGELSNGIIYIEHIPVKMGDNKIESTLNLCVSQQKNAAISFDMSMLSELDENKADDLSNTTITLVQTQQETKNVIVHNMTQIVEQVAFNKKSREERQVVYDQLEVEYQEKISELQDKVNEIYSHWGEWEK